MAYTPNNVNVFTAAYAGALAGMGASDRVISDPSSSDYAGLASVAGAYAQEFDTQWGIEPANTLDLDEIETESYGVWAGRAPQAVAPNLTPATYSELVAAVIATIQASEAYFTAQGITPPNASGSNGRTNLPFTQLWIAPISGSDTNPGTLAQPIKTTAHLNALLFLGRLTANTTITYLEDDTSGTGLDVSTLDLGTFNLSVKGTPVTVHTGGTLNAGTVAIDPATKQRQTAHTSDLATFAPFVNQSPGTATNPTRIVDGTSGAWVVSGVATASCARPVASDGTAGTLTSGHAYTIKRGSILTLAQTPYPLTSGGVVIFEDFAFTTTSIGPSVTTLFTLLETGLNTYQRCSFLGTLAVGGTFSDCYFAADISTNESVFLSAGVWICSSSFETTSVSVSGDTYATGAFLTIGESLVLNLFVFAGIGAGLQVQDMTGSSSANEAFVVSAGGSLTCEVLLWGTGNAGYGLLVIDGGNAPFAQSTLPTVTGTKGDFAFEGPNGVVTVARAWDDATGAWTEAGGAATVTTTWAHFAATIGTPGFHFQAHDVASGGQVIARA